MFTTAFFQVVVTIWLAKYPVTFTVPKIYTLDQCVSRADTINNHRKVKRPRIVIECVPTDKREA